MNFIHNDIVDTIGSIDDLIEKNDIIVAKIDYILKLKYSEYFPKIHDLNGNNITTLNDITSRFATGLNPRKNFVLGHGSNYYVTIKNLDDNGNVILDSKCDKIDDDALAKINKRSNLQIGDILFSSIGTIGRTHLIVKEPINWNISESLFTIRPSNVSSEFLYMLLNDSDLQSYAEDNASGSVQKGIRMSDLKAYKFNLPSMDSINDFTKDIKELFITKSTLNEKKEYLNTLKLLYLKKFFG